MTNATLASTTNAASPVLLDVQGLSRVFAAGGFGRGATRMVALDDVSLQVRRGEAVALIGESGSGKSTLARLLLRLDKRDGGVVRLDGVDVSQLPERAFRQRVQLVFQDPFSSLNPMRTVGAQLEAPLVQLKGTNATAWQQEAAQLLDDVGLSPGASFLGRRPDELSGGQRQRVAIARALAASPDVLVADEPTSMLDVSLRGGVLQLLQTLKVERGLGLLLITHDLAAARRVADRVAVLFRGRIVETGPIDDVIKSPSHPYTQSLLQAATSLARGAAPVAPEAANTACAYASRCPHTFVRCTNEVPDLVVIGADRASRCHLASPSLLVTPTRAAVAAVKD
jgi:peptide/nickel transport system ATP-binding protein